MLWPALLEGSRVSRLLPHGLLDPRPVSVYEPEWGRRREMTGKEQKLTKGELKREVRQIILAQGNDFIKELLRSHNIKIGATKKDFATNLATAIDEDKLTQDMIEAWLKEIEGWGDQHLYLFEVPAADSAGIEAQLRVSEHASLLEVETSYTFPNALELTRIALDREHLSLVWHQGKPGWDRVRAKDFTKPEGLETYRYEAFRERIDRSVMRFEWRFDDGFCAVMIHRNKDIDHDAALGLVWEMLEKLGLSAKPLVQIALNRAVKAASRAKAGVQSSRFDTEGGFIELASTLAEGGIEAVEPIRQARLAVDDGAFAKAQGMFHFEIAEPKPSRTVALQVFGSEGRLRLWAQCRREDVYQMIGTIWRYNQADGRN